MKTNQKNKMNADKEGKIIMSFHKNVYIGKENKGNNILF